jgi:predicted RND superfamily exporter protein
MMVVLPAILIVTGTSIIVHVDAHYRRLYNRNNTCSDNVFITLKAALKPIFYSSFTTAIGFFTLAFIPVKPLQYFGLFTGVGVIVTTVFTVMVMIATLKMRGAPKALKKTSELQKVKYFNSLITLLITIVFIVVGIFSMFNLKSNSYFLEDLNLKSELGKDLMFYEANFDGVRPIELEVSSNGNDPSEVSFFEQMELLENKIKDLYEINDVLSPVGIIKLTQQNLNKGERTSYQLPTSDKEWNKNLKSIKKGKLFEKVNLWNEGLNIYRMTYRTKDKGSEYQFEKSNLLASYVEDSLDLLKVRPTGVAVLIDKVNDSISSNLMYGLLTSLIVVTLLFWVITKNLALSIISIVPNMLPLLFIFIAMWIFAIPLKIGTAMVFTIVFGLAVDDTIHFLVTYTKERKLVKSAKLAVFNTKSKVARPMILSSLILSAGFILFSFSVFQSIVFLGGMVSCTLFIALLADFYVLPVLLLLIDSKE